MVCRFLQTHFKLEQERNVTMKNYWKIIIPVGIVLLLGIGVGVGYWMSEKQTENELLVIGENHQIVDSLVIPEPKLRYGFKEDSFNIYDAEVKRNENLSDILIAYGCLLYTSPSPRDA